MPNRIVKSITELLENLELNSSFEDIDLLESEKECIKILSNASAQNQNIPIADLGKIQRAIELLKFLQTCPPEFMSTKNLREMLQKHKDNGAAEFTDSVDIPKFSLEPKKYLVTDLERQEEAIHILSIYGERLKAKKVQDIQRWSEYKKFFVFGLGLISTIILFSSSIVAIVDSNNDANKLILVGSLFGIFFTFAGALEFFPRNIPGLPDVRLIKFINKLKILMTNNRDIFATDDRGYSTFVIEGIKSGMISMLESYRNEKENHPMNNNNCHLVNSDRPVNNDLPANSNNQRFLSV